MMGFAVNEYDGVRLAFEDTGTGEPLLLVHGTALSKAAWRGLGYQRALKPRYRVVSLDMRGHGRSDKPHNDDAYTMERFMGDVEAVLDACGLQSVHYFGYSFGARVGLAMAASRQHRLRSLTMLGGTHRSMAGQVGTLFFPDYLEALETGGMEEFIRRWNDRRTAAVDPATRQAFLANDPAALAAYFRAGEELPGLDPRVVQQIQLPVLLIAGSNDHPRAEESRQAAALLPDGHFVELPGLDHASCLSAREDVAALLTGFLERVHANR
ncbi:alpha/beta fold hydrolase [Arthrobacter sp.]|uniref:alpha/beta fold hydrolase n=1 Tax=Arthrobacter sp. TaxID=1667 RepID=UPI0033947DFA